MKARVIQMITKLELGGAQKHALYLCRGLDRSRFSVALWSGPDGIMNDDARAIADLEFAVVPDLVRELSPRRDPAALYRLTTMLRAEVRRFPAPVIVHTNSSKAGILGRWAAWLARVPAVVHTFHGFGFNDFQPWPVRTAYVAAEWLTGRITDRFVAVSRANLDKAVELGLARPDHIFISRAGIKISEFERRPIDVAAKKRSLGLEPEGPLALMVACLKPQKSPVDFVGVAARVVKQVPTASFAVAGDGELRPELEATIAAAGLGSRVKLLGWRHDVPELMWAADAFVLTSLWEGLPQVYPQAIAAGLPIVGTRVDGGPEVVIDGANGWLLEPHDLDGLAARLVQLFQDPAKSRAMGQAGRKLLPEFDADLMVRQHEALYDELADRTK